MFAAYSDDADACQANSGIIDLGDRTLVFDTFVTPAAGAQLRQACVELTGRLPDVVVNSHHHLDHSLGNQEFVDCALLMCEARTHELMHARFDAFTAAYAECRRLLDDPSAAAQSGLSTHELQEQIRAAALVHPTLPNVSFSGPLTLHGTRRHVTLVPLGACHSGSDTVLWLPFERILFTGDVAVSGHHPWLTDGATHAWVSALEQLKAYDPAVVIPGHGRSSSVDALQDTWTYLHALADLTRGWSTAEVEQASTVQPMPAAFERLASPEAFGHNLRRYVAQRRAASTRDTESGR
ncbi:MBL fold metallo-hydrolase [Deinococcus pimensis]|uniref:MBL fold metallo-hydrolase n=1 Tax=Deinococcus pimensis TaxID=309888 RepID=UPI00146F9F64|nr:MBL fold metallo-hydrolase [Deinococcus pimensis]